MDGQVVGEAFLYTIASRNYAAGKALLADDVRFRMLVPDGFMTEVGAEATIGRFAGWFGGADSFEVETTAAQEIEGRVAITYRFRLHRSGGWQAIEQHLMLDVDPEGRVTAIDLLCSGFRSVAACNPGRVHRFDSGDLGCADGLAAEFRRRIQQIPVGNALVVTTRDPAAKEDLPSLAR